MVSPRDKITEEDVLHGFTAMAELKLARGARVPYKGLVLHGFTAMAELKLFAELESLPVESRFSMASPPWPN